MSTIAMNIAKMIDMLPESEQFLAQEFVKRLVLAWDPDFTKVTPDEANRLENAENGEFVRDSDIDWDNISKYAE